MQFVLCVLLILTGGLRAHRIITDKQWATAIARSVENSRSGDPSLFEEDSYYAVADEESSQSRVKQICYDGYGCFDRSIGGRLPSKPADIAPWFSLNTQTKQVNITWEVSDDELSSKLSEFFQDERPLIIVAHGFTGHLNEKWMWEMNTALLNAYPNAVTMLMDWGKGAFFPLYLRAASNVPLVARMTEKLVLRMRNLFPSIKGRNIHFIGHSLGGQISGFFARFYAEDTKTKIGRITALDTAAPLFESLNIAPHRGDAQFVEGIHTSAGNNIMKALVGYVQPYADVDYYLNGGVLQPNCSAVQLGCHHNRARDYYTSSLLNLEACKMKGPHCRSVLEANASNCTGTIYSAFLGMRNYRAFIGGRLPSKNKKKRATERIIYVKTTGQSPFCVDE